NPAGCDPQAGRSRGRCFGVCEVRGDRLRQRVLEQQERSGALVSTRAPLYAATAAADGLAATVLDIGAHRHGLIFGVVEPAVRAEEHTSELQSRFDLVCR